jgi:CRISPR-associated protein Csd2
MNTIQNRYDFQLFFDCQDGNPNGDPDSDNSPRFDPETFQGLVSDVCLKRKIRDYVLYENSQTGTVRSGYDVFVLAGDTLEHRQRMPFDNLIEPKLEPKIEPKGKDTKPGDIEKARAWMCQHFFDIRAFGAVMSTTDFNCGQVRGPVQLTFSRSIDRIFTTEHTISRQAFTGAKDIRPGTGTFGRKHTVAYGLYRAHGFINPMFADKTGFSEQDLQMLWRALGNMFDVDRSAARGLMATRGLYIFKHNSKLGSAPAHLLFESIKVKRNDGVEIPRTFSDYTISPPDLAKLPAGIEFIQGSPLAAVA